MAARFIAQFYKARLQKLPQKQDQLYNGHVSHAPYLQTSLNKAYNDDGNVSIDSVDRPHDNLGRSMFKARGNNESTLMTDLNIK